MAPKNLIIMGMEKILILSLYFKHNELSIPQNVLNFQFFEIAFAQLRYERVLHVLGWGEGKF